MEQLDTGSYMWLDMASKLFTFTFTWHSVHGTQMQCAFCSTTHIAYFYIYVYTAHALPVRVANGCGSCATAPLTFGKSLW